MNKNIMDKKASRSIRLLVLTVAALGLFACQKSENDSATSQDSAPMKSVQESESESSKLITKAKMQLEKAREVGFEWTTTASLITRAEQADKLGDGALAMELAGRAIKESNNSLTQAKYADEHWQDHTIN